MVATIPGWDTSVMLGSQLLRSRSQVATAPTLGGPVGSAGYYRLQEHYYANTVYSEVDAGFARYKAANKLPTAIRPIYNPTRRAVNFYRGQVYGREWIPWATEVDEEFRLAAEMALRWGGWDGDRFVYVGTGSTYGDAFAEIIFDPERGKAYPNLIHPLYVTVDEWTDGGDVAAYTLRYAAIDNAGKSARYMKQVTKEVYRTFRDEKPYGWGDNPPEWPNPYGFAPGHLVQHRDTGTGHGANVIDGIHPKIDEVNALATAANNYLMKLPNQPIIIVSSSPMESVVSVAGQSGSADAVPWMQTKDKEARVIPLLQDFGIAAMEPRIQSILHEIERDLPETVMSDHLRSMSQATGPGIQRATGDVDGLFREVCGNYDRGLAKFCQMAVSVNAYHAKRGEIDDPQRVFKPFDPVRSFDAGDLHAAFRDRELVPLTQTERAQAASAIELLKTPTALKSVGFTDKEIYGPQGAPDPAPGILAEQENARTTASNAFGVAFGAGANPLAEG